MVFAPSSFISYSIEQLQWKLRTKCTLLLLFFSALYVNVFAVVIALNHLLFFLVLTCGSFSFILRPLTAQNYGT